MLWDDFNFWAVVMLKDQAEVPAGSMVPGSEVLDFRNLTHTHIQIV